MYDYTYPCCLVINILDCVYAGCSEILCELNANDGNDYMKA